jgi:parallel beta-helix repeat protein
VDSVGPGDEILVHAGTYAGARITSSGTSALPIRLAAAPGEGVVLNALSPAASHDGIVEIENFGGTIGWWEIEGFEIDGALAGGGMARSGIDLRDTEFVTVRGNLVYGSNRTGIFTAFSDDLLIENNESRDNCEHGIYTSNSGDRPVIRGNFLHGNAAAGIHMNADLSQGGDGIISGALVENNRIVGNGGGIAGCGFAGGAGINMDGVVDSIVRNNLILDEHASGIALFRIDGALCSQGNRILNNTVLTAADGRWAIVMVDFDGSAPAGCPNNALINNIFYSAHSFRGAISLDEPNPPGFSSHHNLAEGVFSVDDGNNTLTLAQWQALGHGANTAAIPDATALAALFQNLPTGDLHLSSGSAAIDHGTVLADVPTDLDGVSRPQGASHDAGAYEAAVEIFRDGFESGGTGAWAAVVN